MRYAQLLLVAIVVSLSLVFVQGRSAYAAFHFAVIDEVMTSYNGDANVQFVEIRMLNTSQTVVGNTVLAAFDANGNYTADVLVVPSNLTPNTELRWLMGTTQFQTASGVTPDFIMPAGLPTGGGMICWGAPGVDHTIPATYVDCVAYGTYSGPSNVHIGTSTSLDADGHSLQRTGDTNNNAADFVCGDPADPTNHSSASTSLVATSSCSAPTPDPSVGGVAELPEVAGTPLDAAGSSDGNAGLFVGLIAAVVAVAVALGGAAWYTGRQRLRKYRSE